MNPHLAPGVVVIGNHRSGTSSVAGLLRVLGLSVGDEARLIPPSEENPRGFWESGPLIEMNDLVLGALGAAWSSPPVPAAGWEWRPELEPLREMALASFRTQYTDERPWLWKDPRLTVTLPFWRTVLKGPTVAVLVMRDPAATVRSLAKRNGFMPDVGYALAQRSLRVAATSLRGMPVYRLSYESLLADPGAVAAELLDFLRRRGIVDESGVDVSAAAAVIDRSLDRSGKSDRTGDAAVNAELVASTAAVADRLASLEPEVGSFVAPSFDPEPSVVEAILRERRRADVTEIRRQREWRERLPSESADASGIAGLLSRIESLVSRAADLEERLALLDAENESLALSLTRTDEIGGGLRAALAETRREVQRLHQEIQRGHDEGLRLHHEIAARQDLIDSIQRTRLWRLRDRIRRWTSRSSA